MVTLWMKGFETYSNGETRESIALSGFSTIDGFAKMEVVINDSEFDSIHEIVNVSDESTAAFSIIDPDF